MEHYQEQFLRSLAGPYYLLKWARGVVNKDKVALAFLTERCVQVAVEEALKRIGDDNPDHDHDEFRWTSRAVH